MPTAQLPLAGRYIAVPESRQLDLFADMFQRRGAQVLRCPLVSIHDAADPEPIQRWLEDVAQGGLNDLILLTGEGLRRLLGVAERSGGDLKQRFIAQLRHVRTITRGPKPGRALRDVDLRADLLAAQPTTDGVITTLGQENLQGRNVGVQLYGSDPNKKLIDFLRNAGANPKPVAPYVYADESEDTQVLELIRQLTSHRLDAIAFTSSQQVKRLFSVAKKHELTQALHSALAATCVAAVGPVVSDTLRDYEIKVDLIPDSSYFMKPLVRALVARFAL